MILGMEPSAEIAKLPELDTDQHAWWLSRLFRVALFPDDSGNDENLLAPNAVRKWCEALKEGGHVSDAEADPVLALNIRLDKTAEDFMHKARAGKSITAADFDTLTDAYADLISRARALAQKIRVSHRAVDSQTGLRLEEELYQDLQKELVRRSRKGPPFCLAFAKVKGFSDNTDAAQVGKYLAQGFVGAFRPFDDIYTLSGDLFAISLKQTDGVDGQTVAERVRLSFKTDGISLYPGSEERAKIELVCGVAEASGKDTVERLIEHARAALAEAEKDGDGKTFLYEEVSPMGKFIREIDKD